MKLFTALSVICLSTMNVEARRLGEMSEEKFEFAASCHECAFSDPCVSKMEAEKKGIEFQEYFVNCNNKKFVQCSYAGGCFDMPCPSGLVWNQKLKICDYDDDTTHVPSHLGALNKEETGFWGALSEKKTESVGKDENASCFDCNSNDPCNPHKMGGEYMSITSRCSSPEQVGMTLKSWFLDHTNGGSGKWSQCEELCRADPKCKSWMGRNSGNTCYLSEEEELRPKPGTCCKDHHAHTFNSDNCFDELEESAPPQFQEYFKHCNNNKFVQCSKAGQCFEMPCPEGLTWNDDLNTCDYDM